MSSFSSVVRKPGQNIAPKVAPRRKIQRRPQKENVVTEILTPESLQRSPSRTGTPQTFTTDDAPTRQTPAPTTLSPPPTATDGAHRATSPTPPRQPLATLHVGTAISPVQERVHTVPTIATTVVSPGATRTDRVSAAIGDVQEAVNVSQSNANAIEEPTITEPPAKRRKTTASVPDAAIDPQLRATAQSIPEAHSQSGRGTDDFVQQFQSVSSGARQISRLAQSLGRPSRTPRSDSGSDYQDSGSPTPNDPDADLRSQAIQDAAEEVVARAVSGSKRVRRRHRRGRTPEDAEDHKIDEAETSMADLLTDSGLGKRSTTGKRLDSEWAEIKSRWDQKLEENRAKAKLKAASRKSRMAQQANGEELVDEDGVHHEELRLVNGTIMVDEESRLIDREQAAAGRRDAVREEEVQEEQRIYNYVNQNRIGHKAGLRTKTKWTEELTDKFYQGLSMFSTDFERIASFLGGDWTRRQIKAKFVREERANLDKIKKALREPMQFSLNEYGALVGEDLSGLQAPAEFYKELEAQQKRMEEDYEKAKNGDQAVEEEPEAETEADIPVESIETGAAVEDESEGPRQTPATNINVEMAEQVVRNIGRPVAKKQPRRKQREQTGTSKTGAAGGRKSTRGRKPLEGVEERIGNVGDVEL